MATKFTPAPAVQEIAERLIPEYHGHLIANCVKMMYLFRDDVPVRAGMEIWGEAKKVTGLNAFLAAASPEIDYETEHEESVDDEPFFAILISKPIFDRMTLPQQEALVDHELCHCYAEENEEGEVKLTIVSHDLGEFHLVVRRHGLWREEVKTFLKAAQQYQGVLRMEEEEDESSEDAESNIYLPLKDRIEGVSISYQGKEVSIGKTVDEALDTMNKVAANIAARGGRRGK